MRRSTVPPPAPRGGRRSPPRSARWPALATLVPYPGRRRRRSLGAVNPRHTRCGMARSRKILSALTALAAAAPGGCEAASEPVTRTVAPCTWSYFGDPRAVTHGDRVITGCVDTEGRTVVEDFDLATGQRRLRRLFEPLEVDDHNNPSLVFFREPAVRLLLAAQRLPVPARPAQPDALPRVDAAVGGGRRLRPAADGAARARLRPRLHLPEPGRRRRPPVPVHARPVLGAVLHLDHGRRPLGGARGRSWRRRRPRPRTAGGPGGCGPTPSTRRAPTARS